MARIGVAGWWGIAGFGALLAKAVIQLAPLALDALEDGLDTVQWIVLAAWIVFMAYTEGYRAFQRQLAPRVAARAQHLTAHPRPLFAALAPLYVMGLIHATRRRLITSWAVLVGVVALVIGVRELAQPWRGIVDAGVVIGLAWGTIAMVVYAVRGMSRPIEISPDVPAEEPAS